MRKGKLKKGDQMEKNIYNVVLIVFARSSESGRSYIQLDLLP